MSKETSARIAQFASYYMKCPDMVLTLRTDDGGYFTLRSLDIQALAASCLAQREQSEPSISVSKVKAALQEIEWVDTITGLRNLIDEAEKESEK